jgi:hypothetical protein
VDYFSAFNDFGGFFNTPNYPNPYAFVALKADGSITAWGHSSSGGTDAPSGNGYTKIYSTERVFAAVKVDGSITAWGDSTYGGTIPTSNSTSD